MLIRKPRQKSLMTLKWYELRVESRQNCLMKFKEILKCWIHERTFLIWDEKFDVHRMKNIQDLWKMTQVFYNEVLKIFMIEINFQTQSKPANNSNKKRPLKWNFRKKKKSQNLCKFTFSKSRTLKTISFNILNYFTSYQT